MSTETPGTAPEGVDLPQDRLSTYAAFYNSDLVDAYNGEYAGLMAAYKVDEALRGDEQTRARQSLWGNILQTKDVAQSILTLLPSDGRLLLIHRLYYFPKPLGSTVAKEWEEEILGFVGDVMGTQLPQAVFLRPEVLDALEEKVKVKKVLALRLTLEGDPSLENVPPVDEREAREAFDEVATRYAMCVPPKYVGLFLGKRMTPREGFLAAERAIRENQDEQPLEPLLSWLRVAVTRGGMEETAKSKVALPMAPGVPMVTPELADRLQRLVRSDLPAWQLTGLRAPLNVPAPPSTQQQQLEQLLLTQLLKQQGAGISAETEKLPSTLFKGTINLLLRLTNKADEKDLPEIYHRWANSNKKEFRTVLQEVFDQNAILLGLPEPVATPDLALTIASLKFASADEDDLEQGLQPFAVAYHSQKTLAEQAALNGLHDLLYLGTPQLTDLWAMKAANKLWIPTKLSQLVRTMKSFAVVLATVVGTDSLLYQCYKAQVVDAYEDVSPTLENYAERRAGQPIYAQVLRWLQLRFNEYWRQAQRNAQGPVAVPDFTTLYTAIKYKNWLPPEIPVMYLREGELATSSRQLSGGPALVGSRDASGNPPAQSLANKEANKVAPKAVKNDEVPETVRALASHVGKIQKFLELVGDGRPAPVPKNNKGQDMCLAWYVKGGCYNTCQRRESHVKLSPIEEKRLCDFLKKGIAKQQPTAAGGGQAE